jgi:hypothetical protein
VITKIELRHDRSRFGEIQHSLSQPRNIHRVQYLRITIPSARHPRQLLGQLSATKIQPPWSAPIGLAARAIGGPGFLGHSCRRLICTMLRDQERIMDREFAGSMLIVGVYVIAVCIMLASPQLALFIMVH